MALASSLNSLRMQSLINVLAHFALNTAPKEPTTCHCTALAPNLRSQKGTFIFPTRFAAARPKPRFSGWFGFTHKHIVTKSTVL
jgi:hypothetical protein